jgi:aminopeptidase YwaD
MKKFFSILVLAVLFPVFAAWGQKTFDFSDEAVINRLKQDVYTLASDEMEGRESGTEGERLAAEYIRERMQEIGLQPLFGRSFIQEFLFPGEWVWGDSNVIRLGSRTFRHDDDFFTLPGSGSASVRAGFVDVGFGLDNIGGYSDFEGLTNLEGKIFLMEFFVPEVLENEVNLSFRELIQLKIQAAADRGAAGIMFVNTKSGRDDPRLDMRITADTQGFPVVFLREPTYQVLMQKPEAEIYLSTELERTELTGLNVAGYIDNNAPTTVVIGGHIDHVGYGRRGSRSPAEELIHYGADDNASGTAGVLEAARYLIQSDLTNHNYLFIGFGAEEKGLIGSRYFTNSDAYDMERVNYMFNLDMIGRLDDFNLTMIGTGTSPVWEPLIDELAPEYFNIRKVPGGTGGSDHTNFYLKDIPVIFFFTGTHEDYHRPGDTPDKINYEGTREIMGLVLDMVAALDREDRLAFTSTPSVPRGGGQRTSGPTLGLMPDFGFDGTGLRVQAVMENRPGHQAGLQNGDVIIRIDDAVVLEIESYMEAIGKFRAGQTSVVVVKRGEEEVSLEVSF